MTTTNIIGDIAGQYKALMALIDKMPDGEIIAVGDLIDRGPRSKEVLDYFVHHLNTQVIMGNHEHMMLDYLEHANYYDAGTWMYNGGVATLQSVGGTDGARQYTEWLRRLPLYLVRDNVLISHSFVRNVDVDDQLKYACDLGRNIWTRGESTIIWNREFPIRLPDYRLQVCGHNSQFGLHQWEDNQGVFAICLDDCRKKKLTGLCLETMKVYQQDYLE